MSFIVKGAEIPKTCLDCPLSDIEQGWCASDMVTIIDFNELPVECPLVALPERLTDDDLETISRPKGQWIPCTKNGLPLSEIAYREGQKWYGYKCSRCNYIYKGNALTESPYCQKCGADMQI